MTAMKSEFATYLVFTPPVAYDFPYCGVHNEGGNDVGESRSGGIVQPSFPRLVESGAQWWRSLLGRLGVLFSREMQTRQLRLRPTIYWRAVWGAARTKGQEKQRAATQKCCHPYMVSQSVSGSLTLEDPASF